MEIKRHYRPDRVKKYEARWYVEGRLKCRFFATEAERKQFIEEFQEQLARNGTGILNGFDPGQMRRCQEAARLAPDADPVALMRFWLAHNRLALTPMRFSDANPAYLRYLEAMQRGLSYRKHVESRLPGFAEAMGDRPLHEVTHPQAGEYILGLPYAQVTKRHHKRTIAGAYACRKQIPGLL